MIADQQIGTNFMKALGYNLRKMDLADVKRRPELLETNFTSLRLSNIRKEVNLMKQLRPNLSRYVYHTSLNFSKEENDRLSNEMLVSIAHEYLSALGFTNNQYFIFRHHDAGHPHLHLLVNRICFDGTVVSDSNNYKRSEAVLRRLEYQYNLIPVEQSSYRVIEQDNGIAIKRRSYVADRPPKKDELEMVVRTGRPSDKMVLQEKLKKLLRNDLTLPGFIIEAERQGIYLLFNQASTGRISGVTYFHGNFKAKGQGLGNRFKWMEILKHINYEQVRDSKAVSKANSRTCAKYGQRTVDGNRSHELPGGDAENTGFSRGQPSAANEIAVRGRTTREESFETITNADYLPDRSDDIDHSYADNQIHIQISDDIDDEAILGRNRRRKEMPRTNRR